MDSEPPKLEPKDYIGRRTRKTRQMRPHPLRWVIKIVGWTFVITIALSLLSGTMIPRMHTGFALLILFFFVAVGVFFDILGLSAATADTRPFHSMAARRVPGAVQSLRLLRNPEKLTNFCNDVVGDIAGIISGATASVIVTRLAHDGSAEMIFLQVLFSAVVSSLTVGGKAWGKAIAVRHNVYIVKQMGRAVYRAQKLKKRLSGEKKG